MAPILTALASSAGSVKRQYKQEKDGRCGQDALWRLVAWCPVTWPWLTKQSPGHCSPQLDCGGDNACLWPDEVAEATHLLILFTEDATTIRVLWEKQPNRRTTRLGRVGFFIRAHCPLGRRYLALGAGLRVTEAGWTESVVRVSHAACALTENIWAQQLTATHSNLFLRRKGNGERQLVTTPSVLFYSAQKSSWWTLRKLI